MKTLWNIIIGEKQTVTHDLEGERRLTEVRSEQLSKQMINQLYARADLKYNGDTHGDGGLAAINEATAAVIQAERAEAAHAEYVHERFADIQVTVNYREISFVEEPDPPWDTSK